MKTSLVIALVFALLAGFLLYLNWAGNILGYAIWLSIMAGIYLIVAAFQGFYERGRKKGFEAGREKKFQDDFSD